MNSAMQKYLEAVSGITALTKSSAERLSKQLVKQGEVAGEQVSDFASELLERSRRNRETLTALVNSEIQRAVRTMGLATNDEVGRLQKQVADLKRELATVRREAAAPATAKKSTAKKSTAKKSTAKKSTAKKSTAKKSAAKKSTGSSS